MKAHTIIEAIKPRYHVTEEELSGKSRILRISQARQAAMWFTWHLLRTDRRSDRKAIAKLFNRDIETVKHGSKQHSNLIETSASARTTHDLVMGKLLDEHIDDIGKALVSLSGDVDRLSNRRNKMSNGSSSSSSSKANASQEQSNRKKAPGFKPATGAGSSSSSSSK